MIRCQLTILSKNWKQKRKTCIFFSELVIEVDESDFADTDVAKHTAAEIPVVDKKTPTIAAANNAPINSDKVNKFKDEISDLKSKISKMETDRVELLELARRRQNDFENYKNRTERERSETFRNQLSNLARQMLPVLDNMNRALDSTTNLPDGKALDFQQFFQGIALVNQQLSEVLTEMGVQPIISVGEVFDPHLHEAVATEETNEVPPHTVTAELLRGYRIDEKIIRPSMVKVSKS